MASAAADHGRRNDRRADGATVHRLDNRYESHGGPPRGRNLDHLMRCIMPFRPAIGRAAIRVLRCYFDDMLIDAAAFNVLEASLDQDNPRGLRAEPRCGHIPAHERAFGE